MFPRLLRWCRSRSSRSCSPTTTPTSKNVTSDAQRFGIGLGVIGVTGLIIALVWSGIRTHRIDNTLYGVMVETAKTTSLVFIILLGAAMLTAAFRAFGGEEIVRDFLNGLPRRVLE